MEKLWMTLGRLVSLLSQNLTNLTNSKFRKCGADTSLDTAWRAVSESLKSILTGVPQSMLDRLALVETLAHKIRSRIQIRLPSLLSGLQGKSQIVQDELLRLAESMVSNSEGTKALALELSHEFEDKFFQHIMTGEPPSFVTDEVCTAFDFNCPGKTCLRKLEWRWHGETYTVNRSDNYQLRRQIQGKLNLGTLLLMTNSGRYASLEDF